MKGIEKTASPRRDQGSHRLRDVLLYVIIGLSIGVMAFTLGVYQAETSRRPENLLKWAGFSIMTLLVFSWAVREHRPRSVNSQFYKLLGLFAVIHVVLWVSLLLRTTITSLFPFIIATPLEYFLLSFILTRIRPSGGTGLP